MKKIDIVQVQQDIQFIYNCYKHFGLDVDECRAVLKERDCCEHRDSDGHLLFDEASSLTMIDSAKNCHDTYICKKCHTVFSLKINPDTQEYSYNEVLRYNSLDDLLKPDFIGHIKKSYHILDRMQQFTPKDVTFFHNNLKIQAELLQRETRRQTAILEKLDHITLDLPYYDDFSAKHIRSILFPLYKQMTFRTFWVLSFSVPIFNTLDYYDCTVNLLDDIPGLNMDEALMLIEDCFKKAGTTLQESRRRYAWEPVCNHRDEQGNLLIHNLPNMVQTVECERCHAVFALNFNEQLGKYIHGYLLDDRHFYDFERAGVAEEAEAVLEKDRLSNVHSLTDYYDMREELKEQYQAVMEDKMACWELVGRLNTCLLEIDGLNTFTRHQVEDSVLYAQKEMIDRYLWQHEIQKQLKARLKEFGILPSLKYPWYNKKNTKTEDTEKGKILHGTFLSDHR